MITMSVVIVMLASVYLQVDMKASDDAGLPIREVARRFDVPTYVLRHWEAFDTRA